MAKSKPINDPTIQPPDETLAGSDGDDPKELDPAEEIAKLRAELAAKTAEADAAAKLAEESAKLRDEAIAKHVEASDKLAELGEKYYEAITARTPPAINFDGPLRKFVVAVQDAPTWCVEAPHESLAFDAYKKASGMIATPHVPSVTAAHADHPLGKAP